jgi:hypothetical protein
MWYPIGSQKTDQHYVRLITFTQIGNASVRTKRPIRKNLIHKTTAIYKPAKLFN